MYRESNMSLVIYAVYEQVENGTRTWFIHSDKGFLPNRYNENTIPSNPICINLRNMLLSNDGDAA